MFFKLSNINPYRDLVKYATKVAQLDTTDALRAKEYRTLYRLLKDRLKENEQYLNSSPAFSRRCEHWNSLDVSSIKPVSNLKNPWLSFKREFEKAINASDSEVGILVSKEIAWFTASGYKEDWLAS